MSQLHYACHCIFWFLVGACITQVKELFSLMFFLIMFLIVGICLTAPPIIYETDHEEREEKKE